MKKTFALMLTALLCAGLFAVFPASPALAEDNVLYVHNWQDYLNEEYVFGKEVNGTFVESETGFKAYYESLYPGETVEVVYTNFGTNEIMYNDIRTGKGQYDLACPSDYMIERMKNEDMIETLDLSQLTEYTQNVSPLFSDTFEQIGIADYAVGYMWGTMGMVYNPETVSASDMSSWAGLWNALYANKMTIKDSVRDTYFAGVGMVYRDELLELRSRNELDPADPDYLDDEAYNAAITEVFNRTDDETLAKVENALKLQKALLYGYEVDSGKTDMIAGKIDVNFAWSGDAVYTMDYAQYGDPDEMTEEELENWEAVLLNYAVPEEGSNLWFDGWVMLKNDGLTEAQRAQKQKMAYAFLNYLSLPETAAANMDFIGYTSAIAGDAVFDQIDEWYGVEEGDEGYTVDLTYFFDGTLSQDRLTNGRAVVTVAELGRQFSAQYPTEDIIKRCAIMQDFGDRNQALLDMWGRVKGSTLPAWAIILIVVVVVAAAAAVLIVMAVKKNKHKKRRVVSRG